MLRIATLITAGALTLMAGQGQPGKIDAKQVAMKAKDARTAVEHNEVARLYEQQAATLEAKAKHHEQQADSLASRINNTAMAHKWPAMVQGPIDRERSKAMQARRAARESLEKMAYHRGLAAKGNVSAEE